MKIKVVNQRLYLEPPETAEGTREYLKAEFSFSEEWDGMTKTAFFRGADGNICSQLLENDACTVPAEALAAPGRVGVSVSGTLGETVITTDIKSFSAPATLSGGTPSDPGPTLWQEVLDKFEKVSEVEEKVTELKSEIATKITAPENPEVGKVFKIKSVNDDGTFIGEWADCTNLDVRINGESIVKDGVAEIPLCTKSKAPGLITIDTYSNSGGLYRANNVTGLIRIGKASDDMISKRNNGYCPVVPTNLDYAVKAAMCDGKGAAWTADEQAAARKRMGALSTQDMIDITEITMDAETLKYVFPSFADYRILEISFLKTYKATTGLTGIIWLRIANNVGWSIAPSYAYNTFTLDASGKSCIGKSICTNNAQIETDIKGLTVDKKYWNTEFREAPYLLLPNAERAQYYAECNTVIKVRGIKR